MPSIVIKEPGIENFRRFQLDRPIGLQREETTRSHQVTKQLRPNGEGGYLRTVRRSSKLTSTTHQRHVSKSSNSYETSKVEGQSKSEGLSIGVKCSPQHQREYVANGRDYTNDWLSVSNEPKLQGAPSRSFLRIGQHENRHETYFGAVNRIAIFNKDVRDNNIRPLKMQKVVPTSLIVAEDTKREKESLITNNMAASETSCEQFTTIEGNRRLKRNILKSQEYYKTVTKTTNHVTASGDSYKNGFRSSFVIDGRSKNDPINGHEIENQHSVEDRHKSSRNSINIFPENESTKVDVKNVSTSDHFTVQPNSKRELGGGGNRIRNPINTSSPCDTVEMSSSFKESNSSSSSYSLFLHKRLTNGDVSPPSRHELHNHTKDNHVLSSHTLPPTFRIIHKPYTNFSCKNYQETDYKRNVESCSTPSPIIQTKNLKLLDETKTQTAYSDQFRKFSESPRAAPTVTFRKTNQESCRSWKNEQNGIEALREDSISHKLSLNFIEHRGTSSCSSKSNLLKEQNSSTINSSSSGSVTDEDHSVSEFVMEQSKHKESPTQYYFGVPTAMVRTKRKKESDDITLSSSSLDLPDTGRLLSKRLICQEEKENYQESWSGSEQQTTQHSSIKEVNKENSFFRETRNRRGPVEICFSVKSRCQTKTIEDPFKKEQETKEPSRVARNASKDEMPRKCKKKETTELRERPMSAEEYKKETTFSRESRASKDPMEIRFSVTSFEHQRTLIDNAKHITENLGAARKPEAEERNKNVFKGTEVSEEIDGSGIKQQQNAESERKRKKTSAERGKCPIEVSFSIKSYKKKKSMQDNYEQELKLQTRKPLQDNLEFRKEEEHIEKLLDLKERTDKKNSTPLVSVNDLLTTSKERKHENVSSVFIKQSPINERRNINTANQSESAIKEWQSEANNQTINKRSFKEYKSETITDLKENDESICKISKPCYTSKYFNDVKINSQKTNNSERWKEYLSTKFIDRTSSNESSHIRNEMKRVPESFINSFGSPSTTEHSSTRIYQTNITKIPKYNAKVESPLKSNVDDVSIGNDAISRSRDVLDTFNRKKSFADDGKRENTVKIADIQPLKSTTYIKELLCNKLNTESILRLQAKETKKSTSSTTINNDHVISFKNQLNQHENKSQKDENLAKHQIESTDKKITRFLSVRDWDIKETKVQYEISSNSTGYSSVSHLQSDETKKSQRHLLSPLRTNSEYGQRDNKEPEKTVHRCEVKLNLKDYSKEIPAINEKNIVCCLQSKPNHRGFRLKNWKEEVIINRMLFDVKNVAKLKEHGLQQHINSNYVLKMAPTDWARNKDDNSFQLKMKNEIDPSKEIIPAPKRNFYRSCINIETGSIASQSTGNRPINRVETSIKKESDTRVANDSSKLLGRPNAPKERQKGDYENPSMLLQSIENGLKRQDFKPGVYYVYETSL